MRFHHLLLIIMCGLAGCGAPLSGIPFTSSAIEATPEGAYLKQTIALLTTGDYAPIVAALDPAIKVSNTQSDLVKMAAILPAGQPTSIKFLSWSVVNTIGKDRQAAVSAEYCYDGNKWLLFSARLRGDTGKFSILSFHVQTMRESLEQLNAFTFSGKGVLHYFILLAAALAFATTTYALVLCIKTAGLKRKWLWVIFILVGVCAFSLNWTSGELHVYLLQFNLFSASAMRSGFVGPWMVAFNIPLGALVFLSKRKKLQNKIVEQTDLSQPPNENQSI